MLSCMLYHQYTISDQRYAVISRKSNCGDHFSNNVNTLIKACSQLEFGNHINLHCLVCTSDFRLKVIMY